MCFLFFNCTPHFSLLSAEFEKSERRRRAKVPADYSTAQFSQEFFREQERESSACFAELCIPDVTIVLGRARLNFRENARVSRHARSTQTRRFALERNAVAFPAGKFKCHCNVRSDAGKAQVKHESKFRACVVGSAVKVSTFTRERSKIRS